jgi:GMP synthase-like glutamine amidotransferase
VTLPALVLEHGPLGPPGLLGDWLAAEGIPMVLHRVDGAVSMPDPREHAFVVSLGSRWAPTDDHEPGVMTELRFLDRAVELEVPVLGLCFGGQMLASVLGGTVDRAERPELGWCMVESVDPEVVPPGPWLQWHWDRFSTPPGAEEIARSEVGSQAFRHGPHLGVQFHPESTIEIVRGWARADRARLAAHGVEDGVALLEQGRAQAGEAAQNALRLFDGFRAQSWTTRGA